MTPREIDRVIAEAVEPEPAERSLVTERPVRTKTSPEGAWSWSPVGWRPRHFTRDIAAAERAAKVLALRNNWIITTTRVVQANGDLWYVVGVDSSGDAYSADGLDPADTLARALAEAVEGTKEK